MDGENNGSKPYEQMEDLGVFPLLLVGPTHLSILWKSFRFGVGTMAQLG